MLKSSSWTIHYQQWTHTWESDLPFHCHGQITGKGQTVLLVTHALYFVSESEVDYIYTLQNGRLRKKVLTRSSWRTGCLYRSLQEHGGSKKESEEETNSYVVVQKRSVRLAVSGK